MPITRRRRMGVGREVVVGEVEEDVAVMDGVVAVMDEVVAVGEGEVRVVAEGEGEVRAVAAGEGEVRAAAVVANLEPMGLGEVAVADGATRGVCQRYSRRCRVDGGEGGDGGPICKEWKCSTHISRFSSLGIFKKDGCIIKYIST